MAAPAYIGASASLHSGTGAVSPAWPTHQIGDLGILVIENSGIDSAPAVPSGWTEVAGSPLKTGTTNAHSQLRIYWRFATSAAMASQSIGDAGNHNIARIYTFRGVDQTTPFDVAVASATKTTASTSYSAPSLTTVTDDCLIVQVISRANDSSTAAFSAQSNANLTGLTEINDVGATSGDGGGWVILAGTKATAGNIGDTTGTISVSTVCAMFTIALRPAATPALNATVGASESATDSASLQSSMLAQASIVTSEAGADTASLQVSGVVTRNASIGATEAQVTDAASIQARALVGTRITTTEAATKDAASIQARAQLATRVTATEAATKDAGSWQTKVLLATRVTATESGADAASLQATVAPLPARNATLGAAEAATKDTASLQAAVSALPARNATLGAAEAGADVAGLQARTLAAARVQALETATDSASFAAAVLAQLAIGALEEGSDEVRLRVAGAVAPPAPDGGTLRRFAQPFTLPFAS